MSHFSHARRERTHNQSCDYFNFDPSSARQTEKNRNVRMEQEPSCEPRGGPFRGNPGESDCREQGCSRGHGQNRLRSSVRHERRGNVDGSGRGGEGGGDGREGGGGSFHCASRSARDRSPLTRDFCEMCEEACPVPCTDDEPCCAHGTCNETGEHFRSLGHPPALETGPGDNWQDYSDADQTNEMIYGNPRQRDYYEFQEYSDGTSYPAARESYQQRPWMSEESIHDPWGPTEITERRGPDDVTQHRRRRRRCDFEQSISRDSSPDCEACRACEYSYFTKCTHDNCYIQGRCGTGPRASSCPPDLRRRSQNNNDGCSREQRASRPAQRSPSVRERPSRRLDSQGVRDSHGRSGSNDDNVHCRHHGLHRHHKHHHSRSCTHHGSHDQEEPQRELFADRGHICHRGSFGHRACFGQRGHFGHRGTLGHHGPFDHRGHFGHHGPFGHRGFGHHGPFGHRGFGHHGPFGHRGFGHHGQFGHRGFGHHGPFGHRGFGHHGPFGHRGFGHHGPFGHQGFGHPGLFDHRGFGHHGYFNHGGAIGHHGLLGNRGLLGRYGLLGHRGCLGFHGHHGCRGHQSHHRHHEHCGSREYRESRGSHCLRGSHGNRCFYFGPFRGPFDYPWMGDESNHNPWGCWRQGRPGCLTHRCGKGGGRGSKGSYCFDPLDTRKRRPECDSCGCGAGPERQTEEPTCTESCCRASRRLQRQRRLSCPPALGSNANDKDQAAQ